MAARFVYRSAVTGKYVSKRYALRHPDRTVSERVGVVKAARHRIATVGR